MSKSSTVIKQICTPIIYGMLKRFEPVRSSRIHKIEIPKSISTGDVLINNDWGSNHRLLPLPWKDSRRFFPQL